jgi:P27 family predicted phage terminase small subunit
MGNQNSGPKPQPTAIKLLRGVTRADRLNPLEPKPPTGPVTKPTELSGRAAEVWDELAPVCIEMGTLTPADVLPFVRLCELQATAQEASRQKDAPGFAMFTVSEDYNGADKVGIHAAIRVERETAIALRPYYEYFGLTPGSRARLTVPKKAEEPVSKWAGALK